MHFSSSASPCLLHKKTPWPESAIKLYRPSDRRLSAKLLPTFADRGWHVVSVTDLYGRIFGFLDRSRYFFSQVAPKLYSQGWVVPVQDPLLTNSVALVRERTIPTERPPLVGEVSANFCW
jgi:hypothetical protein